MISNNPETRAAVRRARLKSVFLFSRIFVLVVLCLVVKCRCRDKDSSRSRRITHVLPLSAGNSWTYAVYMSTLKDTAVQSTIVDTLYVAVTGGADRQGWYPVTYEYWTGPLGAVETVFVDYKDTDSGLYVLGYENVLGETPLLKQLTYSSQDTLLMLPGPNTDSTWSTSEAVYRILPDTTIQWDGDTATYTCHVMQSVSVMKSDTTRVYYDSYGIIHKDFPPATVSESGDDMGIQMYFHRTEYSL